MLLYIDAETFCAFSSDKGQQEGYSLFRPLPDGQSLKKYKHILRKKNICKLLVETVLKPGYALQESFSMIFKNQWVIPSLFIC